MDQSSPSAPVLHWSDGRQLRSVPTATIVATIRAVDTADPRPMDASSRRTQAIEHLLTENADI